MFRRLFNSFIEGVVPFLLFGIFAPLCILVGCTPQRAFEIAFWSPIAIVAFRFLMYLPGSWRYLYLSGYEYLADNIIRVLPPLVWGAIVYFFRMPLQAGDIASFALGNVISLFILKTFLSKSATALAKERRIQDVHIVSQKFRAATDKKQLKGCIAWMVCKTLIGRLQVMFPEDKQWLKARLRKLGDAPKIDLQHQALFKAQEVLGELSKKYPAN